MGDTNWQVIEFCINGDYKVFKKDTDRVTAEIYTTKLNKKSQWTQYYIAVEKTNQKEVKHMKECYGNYMDYPICQGHQDCKEEGCFTKTNMDKGACECEFKENCHLTRQWLQRKFKEENPNRTKEDCSFYPLFIERYGKQ